MCGKTFSGAQLHFHIVAERPAIRERIIQSIQLRRPDWTHERGICRSCWELHRLLSDTLVNPTPASAQAKRN